MPSLAERFEAKVDRAGDHHLWQGATKADGAGALKVDGKLVTAARVAWELTHGALPDGTIVRACPDNKACVRVEHLSLGGTAAIRRPTARRSRAPRGGGSRVKLRDGVWKLTVTAGRYADGRPRRLHETVYVDTDAEAAREQARFVTDVNEARLAETKADRDITVDDAIEQYLAYLVNDKGRAESTIRNYRKMHRRWFRPEIGGRRVADVDQATMDRIFGKIHRAGLSASRMNDGRNLYGPFFRWAKRRGMTLRNPMAEFEMPTSTYIAQEHVPPEVEQLCLYLQMAVEVVPDVAPVLVLDAVTGMRRGELVIMRRSGMFPRLGKLKVTSTKTHKQREVSVDPETMAMLLRHCERMDERAAAVGTEVAPDGFVFSLETDCSKPMSAEFLTRRVSVLKDHLGIPNKRPETVELEDEALRLFRLPPQSRPPGTRGPRPKGGMAFKEIGHRLGRSGHWAEKAVASAMRREGAPSGDEVDFFDGSIQALRKFTSSELLDAGFNMSAVAQRQGHGPLVLMKHYSKRRASADRRAADHLGRIVHGEDAADRSVPQQAVPDRRRVRRVDRGLSR